MIDIAGGWCIFGVGWAVCHGMLWMAAEEAGLTTGTARYAGKGRDPRIRLNPGQGLGRKAVGFAGGGNEEGQGRGGLRRWKEWGARGVVVG